MQRRCEDRTKELGIPVCQGLVCLPSPWPNHLATAIRGRLVAHAA